MYCLHCSSVVRPSLTYAGEPSFTCENCGHEVAAAVAEYATTSASERNAQATAKRRKHTTAWRSLAKNYRSK